MRGLAESVVLTLKSGFFATADMAQSCKHWDVTSSGAVWPAIADQVGFLIGARRRHRTAGVFNILLLAAQIVKQAIVLRVLTGSISKRM